MDECPRGGKPTLHFEDLIGPRDSYDGRVHTGWPPLDEEPVVARIHDTSWGMATENHQEKATPQGGDFAIVGVTVCLDPGKRWRRGQDYWYLNRAYTRSAAAAGLQPILLSPDTPVQSALSFCKGLILSGGGDLPETLPALATPTAQAATEESENSESSVRIEWERQLLHAFADAGRPVLGICFGMQLINLHFGGSLYTNLETRNAGTPTLDHGRDRAPSRHSLVVSPNSQFLKNWSPPSRVSSAHRQAVKEVAPGFSAIAHSDDGVVEAIERDLIVGIEWHPESDASGPEIYGRFSNLLTSSDS